MPFLPILTLTLAAFAIGTTEFAVQGLPPEISKALGVSIPTTGLLVTGHALGVALGGPLLTIATNRLRRRSALLSLLVIFVVGHVLCAIAPTYVLLMIGFTVTAWSAILDRSPQFATP